MTQRTRSIIWSPFAGQLLIFYLPPGVYRAVGAAQALTLVTGPSLAVRDKRTDMVTRLAPAGEEARRHYWTMTPAYIPLQNHDAVPGIHSRRDYFRYLQDGDSGHADKANPTGQANGGMGNMFCLLSDNEDASCIESGPGMLTLQVACSTLYGLSSKSAVVSAWLHLLDSPPLWCRDLGSLAVAGSVMERTGAVCGCQVALSLADLRFFCSFLAGIATRRGR